MAQALLQAAPTRQAEGLAPEEAAPETAQFVNDLVAGRAFKRTTKRQAAASRTEEVAPAQIQSERFFIYRYDPAIKEPLNPLDGRPRDREDEICKIHAVKLLECLDLHGQKVGKVRVKKVTIDVGMEDECC